MQTIGWSLASVAVPDGSRSAFQINEGLCDILAGGRCVAFVGAGFSRPIGMPTWAELLNELVLSAERFGKDADTLILCRRCIEERDFTVAATIVRRLLPSAEIDAAVQRAFSESKFTNAPTAQKAIMIRRMKALAGGPWAGIITTNYDTLIERALTDSESRRARVALDYSRQLGTVLHELSQDEMFFVKLHGSISHSHIMLSTKEYDEAYIASSKIRIFLNSTMLAHTVIFLGASVEDNILQVRRELCVDYGGHLPTAYALLPKDGRNERRAEWLRDFARIETLFYPPGDHEALDDFLVASSKLTDLSRLWEATLSSRAATLKKIRDRDRLLNEMGAINRAIFEHVAVQRSGAISKQDILSEDEHVRISVPYARLTVTETFYRIMYMVSVGLIAELDTGEDLVYSIDN